MKPTITIAFNSDNLSKDIVSAIAENQQLLLDEHVDLILTKRESFSPELAQGIIIGISTGVVANYVTKFFDYLIEIVKKKKSFGISIIVKFGEADYDFPSDYNLLKQKLGNVKPGKKKSKK